MTLCICTIGNLTSIFKYITPLLPFFKETFFSFRFKTLLSISCRITRFICQLELLPVVDADHSLSCQISGFPKWAGLGEEAIWTKCPKTVWKLQNQHFWVKTMGNMGEQANFQGSVGNLLSPLFPLGETLNLLFYFFWALFIWNINTNKIIIPKNPFIMH